MNKYLLSALALVLSLFTFSQVTNVTFSVTQFPPLVTPTATPTAPSCGASNGSITATITGGQTPYNVNWSNGDFGLTADSLTAGQYVVQVTDAIGCYASLTVNLNPSNGPVITSGGAINVTCNGGNNGSIALNISGGTNILWSNGATTPFISNLSAGVYDLVLSDPTGCVVNASYTVTEPDPIVISFSNTPANCGNSDGNISATVTGGNSPYNYLWSANAGSQSSSTAVNLASGFYTLTVTDANNCSFTSSVILPTDSFGPGLNLSSTASGGCGNNANGSIDLTVTGNSIPYLFQWSNGAITEDLSNLSPGTYSVLVTGNDGCSNLDTVSVADASGNTLPDICLVTVDTATNTNILYWEKPPVSNGIKEYNIYRESSIYESYLKIHTMPFDSAGEYHDTVANPSTRGWRYKISYVDSCGNESIELENPKTMNLYVGKINDTIFKLSWDQTEDINYNKYYVWRYHTSNNWSLVDSVVNNGFGLWYDINPPQGDTLKYFIEVINPVSCTSSRGIINTTRSNIRNIPAPPVGVGISEIDASSIKIFPNPANQSFQMEMFVREKAQMTIMLYDVRGRQIIQTQRVLTSGKNKETVNISELESGVYFINVQVGEKIFRTKLVKES
ncbi:MAG: T9SS type A sorting domain-containing protein [Bacteroidota bacterium]